MNINEVKEDLEELLELMQKNNVSIKGQAENIIYFFKDIKGLEKWREEPNESH